MAQKDDYLIDLLVDLGLATQAQVDEVRPLVNRESDTGVVDMLIQKGYTTAERVLTAKAAHFGAATIRLQGPEAPVISKELLALVPAHLARKYRVVPVGIAGDGLTIAITDPAELSTLDSLAHLLDRDCDIVLASNEDVDAALDTYYPASQPPVASPLA